MSDRIETLFLIIFGFFLAWPIFESILWIGKILQRLAEVCP